VAGSSAGAHLAGLTALTTNDSVLQPSFEQADTSVAGAICLYGFYGSSTWIDREPEAPSSPAALVDGEAPPMFIVHGDLDSFVSVEQARSFSARLRAASANPVVYSELPGAQHTFDLYHSLRMEAVVDGVEAFTSWIRSRRAEAPGAQHVPGIRSSMEITAFAISLNVEDPSASADFAKRHFGFQEEMAADGSVSLAHPNTGFNLVFLSRRPRDVQAPMLAGRRADGLLVVFVVEDVDAEYARLLDEGIEMTTPIETEEWGERFFQVTDPSGVVFQLVTWIRPPAEDA
jgi:uncharacterized glyoxalase superfamily protein PhnB